MQDTKEIWVRRFTRHEGPDDDAPATDEFKKKNFTDHFGKFLQKGTNSSIDTFDELVTVFWSRHLPMAPVTICN